MSTADREIIQTRLVHAPRELVWRAFTEPKHLDVWWGPRAFATTTHSMELKPGGMWIYDMVQTDGTVFPNVITWKEIEKPSRLAYDHGAKVGEPPLFQVVTTFEEKGAQTLITMRSLFPTAAARNYVVENFGAIEGGKQTLDRMEEHAAQLQAQDMALEITRVFDAPLARVWKAFSERDEIAKWWGPKGFTFEAKAFEFRPGGVYHYRMRSPEQTMWGRFTYRDIVKEQRIIFVNAFSDEHGGLTRAPFDIVFPLEILYTLRFSETAGKTTLQLRGVPFGGTSEERAGFAALHASMQGGFGATFDQLDALLK